jgi:glycosyltransferase involved in cell wall biosynthesis
VLARPAFKNRTANPYNAIVYGALGKLGVTVEEYSLTRVTGKHDVFHIHWPETPFNHGLAGALLTTRALLWAMDRLRARGAKLLWSVHNLRAHEARHPRAEQAFFREFLKRIDAFTTLASSGIAAAERAHPALTTKLRFVVPHPHYRGVYPDEVDRSAARRELGIGQDHNVSLFCGRIFEYKNVPELIRTFRRIGSRSHRLIVSGRPRSAAIRDDVLSACASDERVRIDFGHIPDERLQVYLRAADLVVLPYREILNSGSAVLALSFDRPVLLPALGAAPELQQLVGSRWVRTYTELTQLVELSAERVARAMLRGYQQLLGA